MFVKISIGQLCGFLYLFILFTRGLSQFRAGAALDPTDVPGTLGKVAASGKIFRYGVVIDLISHTSIFALAGLLYIAFSPYGRTLALLGTLWRVAEGTILVLNETNNILLLAVAQKFISATGEEAGTLESLGSTLILAENWGMKVAMAFLAYILFDVVFGVWLLFRGGQIGQL